MNKKTPRMLILLSFTVIASALAGIVDRLCYVRYLSQQGYTPKDVLVPWNLFVDFHLSFPGNVLAFVILSPLVFFALLLVVARRDDY